MLYKLISLHFQIYKISYSSRTGFKQNDITQNSLKQKNMNYWPNKDEIRNNCNLQPREERLVPWRTDYWVSEQLIPSETVPSDQLDPVCAQEKGKLPAMLISGVRCRQHQIIQLSGERICLPPLCRRLCSHSGPTDWQAAVREVCWLSMQYTAELFMRLILPGSTQICFVVLSEKKFRRPCCPVMWCQICENGLY